MASTFCPRLMFSTSLYLKAPQSPRHVTNSSEFTVLFALLASTFCAVTKAPLASMIVRFVRTDGSVFPLTGEIGCTITSLATPISKSSCISRSKLTDLTSAFLGLDAVAAARLPSTRA